MTQTMKHFARLALIAALAGGSAGLARADNDQNPFTGYWHEEFNQELAMERAGKMSVGSIELERRQDQGLAADADRDRALQTAHGSKSEMPQKDTPSSTHG